MIVRRHDPRADGALRDRLADVETELIVERQPAAPSEVVGGPPASVIDGYGTVRPQQEDPSVDRTLAPDEVLVMFCRECTIPLRIERGA